MTSPTSLTLWRSAWRQLRAEPGPAVLVIAGLALGLALTLLTVAFMRDLLWADTRLPEAERLVTFEFRASEPGGGMTDWWSDVPTTPLARALRDTGAPVAQMTRALPIAMLASAVDARGVQHHARLSTLLVDPDIEALFGLQPLAGDLRAALASPDGVVLTEHGANQLFGATDVVGRPVAVTADLDGGPGQPRTVKITLTVMAVVRAPRPNGVLAYDALAGFNAPAAKAHAENEASWTMANGHLYARLQPGASAAQVGALAQRLMDQQPPLDGMPPGFRTELRALGVLERGLHGSGSTQRRLQLASLAAAAAGVLALAVINFINLWSVRTLRRQREIGLRKSLGASAVALGLQFFIEALAVAGIAGVAGLLLAWWGTPAVSALMQHRFDAPVLSPATAALTAGLCLAIAACSALPLTSIALRVRPAESLAGRSHSEGEAGRWLRRAMTVVQFAAAAMFAAMAFTVAWQTQHVAAMPRGFEVENRVAVDLPPETTPAQTQALLARIRSWPEVIAVAASPDVPGREYGKHFSRFSGPGGPLIEVRAGMAFTPGWLQLYGVQLLAGRLSADHRAEVAQHAVVLDRRAVRALGFASPEAAIGQRLGVDHGQPATVVAVIDDVRVEGPREAPMPHLLMPVVERGSGVISVHSRQPADTRGKLATLVNETLPGAQAQAATVREQQARVVADDARIARLIAITSVFALGLAAVGIYALAAYTLRRREREIVLRKLHGAGAAAVAGLLLKEFLSVLTAACLVALPIAAWLTQRYLGGFVERAPVGPYSAWVLLASVALLTLVAALAVARHLRAALALRPLQALHG
ncbi:FtsX-like permease family protein [Roseateles asaccharophilus]|uniref:FtsX-like permease family protein n=1 Tax=Roseateles asaccharophilus TaxID=582607 RepID=A0ABU2AEZ7_9BURK|nr:FtsX-like permease family protein [Roseateles asaccharophilus]MDR7335783.1 hypothetical protein [Roseateles asaccharophilus]